MSEALSEAGDEHYSPAVRLCEISRPESGNCGFHLSRTKWDPYPWVSVVEAGSAAHQSGLQVGDCVLEVNGEDVVGQKIGEIAARVRARPDLATLLVWNCGAEETCDPEALCCGPMPVSLKRLSTCLGAVLGALECPVCLDTIPPPAHQCGNGHLMCAGCRARAERCPVCRVRLCRGRSLLADQVFLALTDTFNVSAAPREEQPDKLRQKLMMLGSFRKKKAAPAAARAPEVKVSFTPSAGPANKFLTKLLGKSSSLTNLATTDDEPVRLSAVPRHLSITPDFGPQLKVKSLSTSEINRAVDGCPSRTPPGSSPPSPTPSPGSRSPSTPRAAMAMGTASSKRVGSGLLDAGYFPLGSSQRPASCHSSLESLFEAEQAPLESLFRCPWSASCTLRLPTARLVSHGRAHGGPLLLAFRPHCEVALPLPGPLCVQLPDLAGQPRELFVDTRRREDGRDALRAWLAGSPEDCLAWRLRVSIGSAGDASDAHPEDAEDDSVLLAVRSLSVDALDLRAAGSDGEDDGEDDGQVDGDLGLVSLCLPPHASRLGLDFTVHPVDGHGADQVAVVTPVKRGAVSIVHDAKAHANPEAGR